MIYNDIQCCYTKGHSEELVESLQHLSRELHAACDDPALLSSDFDLLLDSALLLWEVAEPAFSRVHSHEYTSCRQLLSNKIGKQVGVSVG